MELIKVWAVIWRRWWLVLIPTLFAAGLALPTLQAIVSPPISYTATIHFTASARPTGSGSFQDQSYVPWLASESVVNGLMFWIRTESFAREVSNRLAQQGQTISADQIRAAVNSDSARSVLSLILSGWPDPDGLRTIGQASIYVLTERTDAYFPQFSAQKGVVVALDDVIPVAAAVPILTRLAGLERIAIGLGLGLALAFFVEYLDASVRTRAEVEAMGLAVLAEIPHEP